LLCFLKIKLHCFFRLVLINKLKQASFMNDKIYSFYFRILKLKKGCINIGPLEKHLYQLKLNSILDLNL